VCVGTATNQGGYSKKTRNSNVNFSSYGKYVRLFTDGKYIYVLPLLENMNNEILEAVMDRR
jgi:hypothetical protein